MNLVARVYLDEDVSILLAALLKSRHVHATTARDNNMLQRADADHLKKAVELNCVILTHNRGDFENLYAEYTEQSKEHNGIIVLSRKRDVYDSARRVIRFLAAHPDISNQLWYL
jgi:hypothetical protein